MIFSFNSVIVGCWGVISNGAGASSGTSGEVSTTAASVTGSGAFTTSGEGLATGFVTLFTATGFLFAGARFTGAATFSVPALAAASAYAFSALSAGVSGPLAMMSSLQRRDSNAIAAVHNMHRRCERQGVFVQRTMRRRYRIAT